MLVYRLAVSRYNPPKPSLCSNFVSVNPSIHEQLSRRVTNILGIFARNEDNMFRGICEEWLIRILPMMGGALCWSFPVYSRLCFFYYGDFCSELGKNTWVIWSFLCHSGWYAFMVKCPKNANYADRFTPAEEIKAEQRTAGFKIINICADTATVINGIYVYDYT